MSSIGSRIIWLLTSLVIVGTCGWSVSRGFEVFRYTLMGGAPEAFVPWFDTPVVAYDAREHALTSVDSSSDENTIRKRRGDIEGLLTKRPLSSYYWLKLAEIRVAARENPAEAVQAFELSVLTGSNEGFIMTRRGLFGVENWELLPRDVQQRAVADLRAMPLSGNRLDQLQTALSKKTEQVRQDVRLALQAHGFSESSLARIGL